MAPLPPGADEWTAAERELALAVLSGETVVVNVRKQGPHRRLVPWLAEESLLTYVGHAGPRHQWPEWLHDRPAALRRVPSELAGRALGCWRAPAPSAKGKGRRAGCWRRRPGMLVDDLGEPVPLAAPPNRVVSLVPSLTDAIETSRPGLLTGVTDYCTHPPDLDVPRVGGSKYPNVDAALGLRPDLVVANAEENRPEDVARLRADGIPVWVTAAAATVPDGLGSVRRLLTQGLGISEPPWLVEAENAWRTTTPVWATAIIPVWRRPWIVVGRDTFAGDVLRRLGVENAYAAHTDRYPRPSLAELTDRGADLIVLPDEPYEFTDDDGPEAFPGMPYALLNGRHLTWCGPSLAEAHASLATALRERSEGASRRTD